MAFSGKIDHRPWPMLGQQLPHQIDVTNVTLHQLVSGIALQTGQCFRVACVSEFVEVDNRLWALGEPVQHKIGTDESGTAGNK